jgi:hypothetical protein
MPAQPSRIRPNAEAIATRPAVSLNRSGWPPQTRIPEPQRVSTLHLDAAAEFLKVHPKTLQRLAQAGSVPACKIGRAWIFVEHLLVEHLVSKSTLRVSVVDLQEKSECRSTDARTHRFGGSNCRPSGVNRSLYSKALGLSIDERRKRSTTDSPTRDGSKPGSA